MKYFKFYILVFLAIAAVFGIALFSDYSGGHSYVSDRARISETPISDILELPKNSLSEESLKDQSSSSLKTEDKFQAPMDRAKERITKKKFGMFITPETSPVQPDKFKGFHTGTDFEIFPSEIEKDVPIKAVCSGNFRSKKKASGYGGVAVEECELEGKNITVLYGHLKLSSVSKGAGEKIEVGETIGLLGDDKSSETDGARKHLHLAFHLGNNIDLKGYVDSEKKLSGWIDPSLYIF